VGVIDGENQRLLGSLRPETRVESRHSLVEWRSLTVLVSVGPALVGTIGHAVWRCQSASHSMLLVVNWRLEDHRLEARSHPHGRVQALELVVRLESSV